MDLRAKVVKQINQELEAARAKVEEWREAYEYATDHNNPYAEGNAMEMVIKWLREVKRLEDELARWEERK